MASSALQQTPVHTQKLPPIQKNGWNHYSFEIEQLSSLDLLLKLPMHTPEQLPKLQAIHIHWSGGVDETQSMISVQSAFFLATQCRLQVSRAHRDEARFSLRKGIALGLYGQLPLHLFPIIQDASMYKMRYVNNCFVGGSEDLYVIEGIQPYHGFFGTLPGWEWAIKTTAKNPHETHLLTTFWKLHV